jgi:hypothetical protein
MSKKLGVIWNCDHVLKQNANCGKIYAFFNFIFIFKWLTKKCDILLGQL